MTRASWRTTTSSCAAGALAGQARSLDALSAFTPEGVRMRIVASDPQALVAALAREPQIEAVARRDGVVVARGGDARGARAGGGPGGAGVGRGVVEMRLEPPSLEDARPAASGIAQGTYEAARARTVAALRPRSDAPPGARRDPALARVPSRASRTPRSWPPVAA